MSSVKIYFYSPSTIMRRDAKTRTLYLSTTPLYLDSHVKQNDQELYKRIEWTKIQLARKSRQELIDEINHSQADIVCVSLYLWNTAHILESLKDIKTKLHKPVTIIAGGPSVEIYPNRNWLHENPDIDYAVFTQGETPFLSILQKIADDKPINVLNTKNLAWIENNKLKISDFEFLRRSGSHYLESSHLLRQMTDDPEYSDINLFEIPYETSRGCPYSCSFCDWTSGLTHKVSHRKSNWYEEFKLFGECRAWVIHLSDANAGQVKQDIEVYQALIDVKKDFGYDFKIHNANFSKMKKERSFEIMDMLLAADILSRPKFAVQDTNAQVLHDIDRPDIEWPRHKQMILNLKDKYPDHKYFAELIVGLPGQTRKSWAQTMIDTAEFTRSPYHFTVLPNSPAASQEYQKKYKLKIIKTNIWGISNYHAQQKLDQLTVGGIEENSNISETCYDSVIESYSYDIKDYVYFNLLVYATKPYFTVTAEEMQNIISVIDRCSHLDRLLDESSNLILNQKCDKIVALFHKFMLQLFKEQSKYMLSTLVKRFVQQNIASFEILRLEHGTL